MIEGLIALIAGLILTLIWMALRTIKQIATDLEEINETMWNMHTMWWQNR